MKNKINIKYALLLILLLTYSCNEWLAVSPRTEKTTKEFFTTEDGFKDALIGVYIQMKAVDAYGKHLTMGNIEHLASFYDVTNNSYEQKLSRHDFGSTEVEGVVESMFSNLYTIISSTNNILSYIETHRYVFSSEDSYNIVKGECLALRAMCHFDLLRLFGPQSSSADDRAILSYVTTLGVEINPHLSFDEYIQRLLLDLSSAESLLKISDPILKGESSDPFLLSRDIRFNYYAIKALQARVNLYLGNDGAAVVAAKEVVASNKFRLGNSTDFGNNDMTLTPEHIVALYDSKLAPRYLATFYYNNGLHKGGSYDPVRKDIYENSASDIRQPANSGPWELLTTSKILITSKYNSEVKFPGRIPLLRLSEMYLILAEVAPLEEAQEYWKQYLASRSVTFATLTEMNRKNLVMKEYRKEFYAEGQMFFTYKRMNSTQKDILWFPESALVNYVLPLPKTDI